MNVIKYSVEPLLRVAQAFPATPRVMADLGRLLRDPGANLLEVTALLKQDTTLAARLLRIANSVALGQAQHVGAIEDAAALIGLREIHRLVGAVTVDQFAQANYPLYGFSGPRLRDNALFVALLMEELALGARLDPHVAYATGLFRSTGKLALEKLAGTNHDVKPFHDGPGVGLELWEKHSFGITSNEATAVILQQWRFPNEIAQAIGRHFAVSTSQLPLAWLLNLASRVADERGFGLAGEAGYWADPVEAQQRCGLDPQRHLHAVERAAQSYDRLTRAIG